MKVLSRFVKIKIEVKGEMVNNVGTYAPYVVYDLKKIEKVGQSDAKYIRKSKNNWSRFKWTCW